MSVIKYKARDWDSPQTVERMECDRESEHFVWINGRRWAKRSDWESYFDSFDEARDFLIDCAQREVNKAQAQLDRAYKRMSNATALKEMQ